MGILSALFGTGGGGTSDRSADLSKARGSLARHQRELRDYNRMSGGGRGDSTTRRMKADIESDRRAIRLFGG